MKKLEAQILLKREKIVKLKDDLAKLRAELKYWERKKALAMQQKVMGGNGYDFKREI